MVPLKLISTSFLQEKYMSKISTIKTKPKQSQWSQNCWKRRRWTNSEPANLLTLFIGAQNTRNFELKKSEKTRQCVGKTENLTTNILLFYNFHSLDVKKLLLFNKS